ncbi:uncharacterized protein LOC135689136 [Rhopilema esculentum]|uniref:uncharacterized protein LOC135689136 n=1 Tax=Rhopilema esculentum TaxID=499914 RepID=UPI0031CDF710
MGAYRSVPLVEKASNDGEGNGVAYGVSEMQGWRVTMEDAWTCLPYLDESTSMFAVFDGHGGQEVAQFCSKKLANFIKDSEGYKNGDLRKSLDDAFRSIDQSILDEETIKELKELAGDRDEDDDDEETAMLSEEATMPIEELLKRMKQGANAEAFEKLVASNGNGRFGDEESDEDDEDSDDDVDDEEDNEVEENVDSKVKEESEEEKSEGKSSDKEIETKQNETKEKKEPTGEEEGQTKTEDTKKDAESREEKDEKEENVEEEDEEAEEEEEEEEEEEDDVEGGDDDDDDIGAPESDEVGKDSGTTAIVALKRGDQLVVANVGDSRCVLCRGKKAVDMSKDHKPEDESETERITKAGGKITGDGRVNGGLNLSRAIGDHNYKNNEKLSPHEQVITAVPDVEEITLTKDDQFMIIACDGIWNIMTSQEAVDFVSKKLEEQKKAGKICLSKICEEIFDECLAPDTSGDGSGCDNMSCIVILLNEEIIKNVPRKRVSEEVTPDTDENPAKRQKVDE